MSYQGLDTENQRLQKALENSSKKIQQLEAELQEVESENQTLQRNLEELKISSKRLEQLEQEVGKKVNNKIKNVHSVSSNNHMHCDFGNSSIKYKLSFELLLRKSEMFWFGIRLTQNCS